MVKRVLPDTDPVDEHVRRVGAPAGITAARTGNREIQYWKERVSGGVELPIGQGTRRNIEVRLRAVDVVQPEAHACVIPLDPPRVPPAVRCDGVADVFSTVQFCVDGGSRSPAAVAVPLHDVDFAAVDGAVVGEVPRRPAAGSEAVQLDPGFPGGADRCPVLAEELAAEICVAVLSGADDEVGL